MSLVKVANTCAHLQNCTRLRISLTSIPYTKLQLQFAYNLYKQGFISSLQKGSTKGPDEKYIEVTPDNISTRRLWLTLKYRENKSVIRSCKLISKPSVRIFLENKDLRRLCMGTTVRHVQPLQPGELILVKVKDALLDINEAVQKKLSGELICRIN